MSPTVEKLKKKTLKVGKYKVGTPFVSESYKKETPKAIKITSEVLLGIGVVIAAITPVVNLPVWAGIVGGLAGYFGNRLLEAFSK